MDYSSMKCTFHNKNSESVTVIVEPWAEEIRVPSKNTLEITVFYREIGPIETTIDRSHIAVWLWKGCHALVSLNGRDCTPPSLTIPAPG